MSGHVKVLGWLQILLGLFDLLLAAAVFGLLAGFGLLATAGGEPGAALVSGGLATALGGVVALTAVPNLLAGWGLLRTKEWARILALVLAVLNGLKFPWGTAFAVYTIWVLMHDQARPLFR